MQFIKKQNGKIQINIPKSSPLIWLLSAYFVFVLLYTFLNGYCKHIETYLDERIYYSMAEGFAKGLGLFTMVGEPFHTNRFIYSLLISPAFYASNRFLQFRLIALINSLVLCSGVFPTYLLAKSVLKNDRLALVSGIIYLILPDMQFTASFMSENAMLPLSLWTIFLTWTLLDEKPQISKKYMSFFACWVFSSVCLVFVKTSGYVVVIVCGMWIFASIALKTIRFIALQKKSLASYAMPITGAVVLIGLLILTVLYSEVGSIYYNYMTTILSSWITSPGVFFLCYLFTWASEILAIGIFPFVIPLLSFKTISHRTQNLFLFLLSLTAIANFAVVKTSVYIRDSFGFGNFPLYHRYVLYIWLPFIILFIDAIRKEIRLSRVAGLYTVLLTAIFCVLFQGAIIGSVFEAPLLWWARNWLQNRWLWISLVLAFTIGGLYLLIHNKKKFLVMFVIIMLSLQTYNHIAMHDKMYKTYGFPYRYIQYMESVIASNPDSTFLVIAIPTTPAYNSIHINAKVADTYLLYPNSFFVSDNMILGTETENGIDLSDKEIHLSARTDLRAIDYVVLTNEMSIENSGCSMVYSNHFFSIYRLADPTKIPYISSPLADQ